MDPICELDKTIKTNNYNLYSINTLKIIKSMLCLKEK